jgi:hypothetical protein
MRPPGDSGLLDLWDEGEGLSVPERALAVLARVDLGDPSTNAARATGWRDRQLLAVHRALYGPVLSGLVACAGCGAAVAVALDLDALDAVMRPADAADAGEQSAWFAFTHGAFACRCRVPNSADHVAVLAQPDPAAARRALIARCIADPCRDAQPIGRDDLADDEIAAAGAALDARDPGAVVTVDHTCPACGRADTCLLDPPSFVWRKLQNDAQRLLYEVHVLAGAYGWREADVLALPPRRRRRYLRLTSP